MPLDDYDDQDWQSPARLGKRKASSRMRSPDDKQSRELFCGRIDRRARRRR